MKSKSMKDEKVKPRALIEGQLSLWDVMTSVSVKKEVAAEKIEIGVPGLTLDQQKVYNQYVQNTKVSKIINYSGGGLGIELKENQGVKTLYVNKAGIIEFIYEKSISVLPMDKILSCNVKTRPNPAQMIKAQQMMNDGKGAKRMIHRNGDLNVLIEYPGKVKSILPNGWVLEYENIKEIECSHEDVLMIKESTTKNNEDDLIKVQERVKLGDVVEASFGGNSITGYISHIYGPKDITLNIVFDNGTKHTAICRTLVKRILKSA